MSVHDDYASLEIKRRRDYEAAFHSEEARAWRDSLSPAQRREAERLGLFKACWDDNASKNTSIDDLPLSMEPCTRDEDYDKDVIAIPFRKAEQLGDDGWEAILTSMSSERREMFVAFLNEDGNPRLRWACLCFLFGEGTCEQLAHSLAMSKQAFHYHVRKLQKQLGLPPMGNQKQRKASLSYAVFNKRLSNF